MTATIQADASASAWRDRARYDRLAGFDRATWAWECLRRAVGDDCQLFRSTRYRILRTDPPLCVVTGRTFQSGFAEPMPLAVFSNAGVFTGHVVWCADSHAPVLMVHARSLPDQSSIGFDLRSLRHPAIVLRPRGKGEHVLTGNTLRTAIKSFRKVSFDYASRSGKSASRRIVAPLGFLYGHRHYLVALQDGTPKPKFFSLPSIGKLRLEQDSFERDPAFNLKDFVSQSFGVFEEKPVNVVWRFSAEAAPFARTFVFHHSQEIEDQPNGELIVRFCAGGLLEMAWHLMSWGDQVEVIEPASLREMLPASPPSWRALP